MRSIRRTPPGENQTERRRAKNGGSHQKIAAKLGPSNIPAPSATTRKIKDMNAPRTNALSPKCFSAKRYIPRPSHTRMALAITYTVATYISDPGHARLTPGLTIAWKARLTLMWPHNEEITPVHRIANKICAPCWPILPESPLAAVSKLPFIVKTRHPSKFRIWTSPTQFPEPLRSG
jgi:hypothetical protein